MAKPNRIADIERDRGEKAEILIPRLLNKLGSIPAVASHLDTSVQTIYNWVVKNDYEKQTVITWKKRPVRHKSSR